MNNNAGFTVGIDAPSRAFDKLRGAMGGQHYDLPDVGVSISLVIQDDSHPAGEDVALVFTRRVLVGAGFVYRGYVGADVNHGSILDMAGSGREFNVHAGIGGISINTSGWVPTGVSLNAGYGIAFGGVITTSSVWSLKHGYIPSGCSQFVCSE